MTAIAKFSAALSCVLLRLLPPTYFLQKGEGSLLPFSHE